MKFKVPENLGLYSIEGLAALRLDAKTEYDTTFATATQDPANTPDEAIDDLEALRAFDLAVDAELASRESKAARLAALTVVPEVTPAVTPVETVTEPAAAVEPVTDPAPVETVVAGGPAPTAARVGAIQPSTELVVEGEIVTGYATLVASGDSATAGEEIDNLTALAAAFLKRSRGFAGNVRQQVSFAELKRDYPAELSVGPDNEQHNQAVLTQVSNEFRLPGGNLSRAVAAHRAKLAKEGAPLDALVAAGGWCAPSETDYSICFQTTSDGLADFPEVQARRGGIRHNTGLDWSTIYGTADTNVVLAGSPSGTGPTGFFNLTEAQVIAGSPTKTCVQVSCPSFTDTRLGVTGVCLTSPILTNRGYPEFVSTFMKGAMDVHAHQQNALQIAAIAAASTAVTLAATDPWASDGSVTSNLLAAVEMALVDLKYRLRLSRNATVEVILPYWILAQFRADLSRRNAMDLEAISVADAQIMGWFSMRGARPQFVYDWQDKFSSASGTVGGATPVTALPATVQFLVYPAGTWVRAVQDVITLNAVYDSTLLATNMVTQLFTEDGWAMLQMCPISRIYTVPTCPSGSTTAPSMVDCVTP